MSKTYKVVPYKYHRRPKGKLQAMRNEARKKAIPPDAWDDEAHDDQCYDVYNVLGRLLDLGIEDEIVEHKLVNKFHISHQRAIHMIKKWKERNCGVN